MVVLAPEVEPVRASDVPPCPRCDQHPKPKHHVVWDNWGHPWHLDCWVDRTPHEDTYAVKWESPR